jgi:polyhydroxyalkanoate synthesis repressor PhaR
VRILKKYPNRRIYDTETSSFVALGEIRQMIINRESIQVVHSKTGKDLTRNVLLQIITEMESEGHESLLTNRVLEELIRFYGDKLVAMMGPYLEQQILQSLASQDRWREQLTKAFAHPYPTPDQAFNQMLDHYKTLTGQNPAPSASSPDTKATDESPAGEIKDKDTPGETKGKEARGKTKDKDAPGEESG